MSADPPVVLVTGATGPLGRAVVEAVRRGRRPARPRRHATAAAWPRSRPRPGSPDDAWLPVVGDLRDREAAQRGRRRRRGALRADRRPPPPRRRLGRRDAGRRPRRRRDPRDARPAPVDDLPRRAGRRARAWSSAGSGGCSRCPRRSPPTPARRARATRSRRPPRSCCSGRSPARSRARGVTANLVVVRTIDAFHERETAPTTKNAAWTTPEEIADTLAFLASPAAAAVNGARITARRPRLRPPMAARPRSAGRG